MTDTPTTPDLDDIGDTEGQPDGITNDSGDLPDPARAAARVREFLSWFGDGIVYGGEDDEPPLYARDLAALAGLPAEVEWLAREARIWCRRTNTVMADAVEQTARDMQRAGQLRRELDEARAEVERLRAVQEAIVTEWRAVLDRALPPGTQGAGQGLAADVALIASQRDEARNLAKTALARIGEALTLCDPHPLRHPDTQRAIRAALSEPDTVEVSEPAPATNQPYTITPAHDALVTLMRGYATNDEADAYDMADEFLRTWALRPADTGKETDR